MNTQAMTEEKMISLVRNALLVASQEMGTNDAWPVVKDTIQKIEQDWEDVQIERDVDAQLKVHLYKQIELMEAGLPKCTKKQKAAIEPRLKEFREVCDAYFSDIDERAVELGENTQPEHILRMKAILKTMEENHE